MEHRNTALELKEAPTEDGSFEGYASVFETVDDYRDVVAPGAFVKSLGQRKVKMLWQHDPSQPIGVWEALSEDTRGLYVKGRLLKDVARGAEALSLLRAGAIDSMSIGYRTKMAEEQENGRIRRLLEVDLFEISLVTFPANPDATVHSVKSKLNTIREFEGFLRDAGYSKKEAAAIALHGFKGLTGLRDAASEADQQEATAFLESIGQLKRSIQ